MASKNNNARTNAVVAYKGLKGNGGVRRITRMTPDWYQVETTQTIAANGTVNFNLSNIISLISDAEKLGKRPCVHALAIGVAHSGNLAAFGAAYEVAEIQRGCFYSLNVTQPNVKAKWFPKNVSLSEARITGKIINPVAMNLEAVHPFRERLFHRFDVANGTVAANATVPSPDVTKRPDPLVGWDDDTNWQSISSVLAAAFDFTDLFTIPMCSMSGPMSFMNDKLPLRMITDPNNPWRISVTEQQLNGTSIRTDMFKTTAHDVKVSLWVYVSFEDIAGPARVGVQWATMPDNFNGDKILPAHYHRFYGIFPAFDSVATEGGGAIVVPYAPDELLTLIEKDDIRIFDCGEQVFPLPTFSEAFRQIEHFNIGAIAGENPLLLRNPNGTSTRIVGPGSGLAGTAAIWYGFTALGAWSGVPVLPLLTNHLAVHGFPINVMAKPSCTANHRISLEGSVALPAGSSQRAKDIYVAEYDDDRYTAMSYAYSGEQDGERAEGSWLPAVENPNSSMMETAKDLVPYVLNP